ncbi:MAG: hypothetical protein WCP96_17530 [Methylococcaceae bacterium]
MKKIYFLVIAVLFSLNMTPAQANTVLIQDTSLNKISISPVNNLYNSHGIISSIISPSTTITAAELQNTNLFVSYLPAQSYTSPEIDALKGFLNQGGRILFMGDYGFGNSYYNNQYNKAINADISALGGTMASDDLDYDWADLTATVSNGQILPSFLTTGVNSFSYAAISGITGNGFSKFFLGTDLSTVFGAYQQVGQGGIVLLTDITNIQSIGSSNGNGQFYLNVATAGALVPLPAAIWLFGSAFVGCIGISRRKS